MKKWTTDKQKVGGVAMYVETINLINQKNWEEIN